MARFVFRLAGILRQRLHEERQRQRELAERLANLSQLQQALRQLQQRVEAANDHVRSNHLVGRLDVNFLAAHRRFLAAMQRGALELVQRMAIVQRQVDGARAALAESAKRRKAIEKLREKQLERFVAEQDRKETMELDEIALQTRLHQPLQPPAAPP